MCCVPSAWINSYIFFIQKISPISKTSQQCHRCCASKLPSNQATKQPSNRTCHTFLRWFPTPQKRPHRQGTKEDLEVSKSDLGQDPWTQPYEQIRIVLKPSWIFNDGSFSLIQKGALLSRFPSTMGAKEFVDFAGANGCFPGVSHGCKILQQKDDWLNLDLNIHAQL